MTRFDTRIAAGILGGLALVYLVASLATGRSARAEAPVDLSAGATDAPLDVWKAIALLCEDGATVVDVRPADEFALYHLAGSRNEPGLSATKLRELAAQGPVLVVAAKDADAQRLVAEARGDGKAGRIHFLAEGARAAYLALDLPVPLFAEAPPPRGYVAAMATVRAFLARRDPGQRQAALEALQTLARAAYQPSLLRSSGKAKTTGAKKKISGGCG